MIIISDLRYIDSYGFLPTILIAKNLTGELWFPKNIKQHLLCLALNF